MKSDAYFCTGVKCVPYKPEHLMGHYGTLQLPLPCVSVRINVGYRHGLAVNLAMEGIDKSQLLEVNQCQRLASHFSVKYIALRFDGIQRKGSLLTIEIDAIDVGFVG